METKEEDIARIAITNSAEKTLNASSPSNAQATLRTSFSETKTSLNDNTSTLSVTASLTTNSHCAFESSASNTLSIYWFDNNENSSGKLLGTQTVKKLNTSSSSTITKSITVKHKGDGSLSGYAKAVWKKANNLVYTPASGEIQTSNTALTKFARAGVPKIYGFSQWDEVYGLQWRQSFGIEPYLSTYIYTLSVAYANESYNVFEKQTFGDYHPEDYDTIDLCFSEEVYNECDNKFKVLFPKTALDIAKLTSDNADMEMVYTLQTYNGNDLIGTASTKIFFSIWKYSYTWDPEVKTTDALTQNLTGDSTYHTFIPGISNIEASFKNVVNVNGASLKSYNIFNANENYSGSSPSHLFSPITSDNLNFTFYLVDGRGFGEIEKYRKTVNLASQYKVLNYFTPAITKLSVSRPEQLSTTVNMSVDGSFWNASFGAKTNAITLSYRYKLSTSSSWSSYYTITPTKSGNKFTYSGNLRVSLPTTSSVIIEFKVVDSCNKEYTLSDSVSKSVEIFDLTDGYFNINGMICNNDELVPSYKIVNGMAQMLDYQGNNIYPETDLFEEVGEVTIE